MKPDDKFFMKWAQDVARLSNCTNIQVGAVLVQDHRVISIGFNGTLPGTENCDDHYKKLPPFKSREDFLHDHHAFSEVNHLHAEQNAILDALNRGQSCKGATLYTTYSPCNGCTKVILTSGITRVVYLYNYYKAPPSPLFALMGVAVEQLPEGGAEEW